MQISTRGGGGETFHSSHQILICVCSSNTWNGLLASVSLSVGLSIHIRKLANNFRGGSQNGVEWVATEWLVSVNLCLRPKTYSCVFFVGTFQIYFFFPASLPSSIYSYSLLLCVFTHK